MTIAFVVRDGLCCQCGTCAALCPSRSISMDWSVSDGYVPRVDAATCTDCGECERVCPGRGCDFGPEAWWRTANAGSPSRDFLGPWRQLFTGWATDPATRHDGASGGIATAILQGALADGLIDAAIVCRSDPDEPLRIQAVVARTAEEIAACRGSEYNVVDVCVRLRDALDEPGRYALVGLPCHILGARQACERHARLRERVVLTMGIFCGWVSKPRATEIEMLRAGLDPAEVARLRYRGPGWPGCLRFESRSGRARDVAFPAYFDRFVRGNTLPRCRLCPDGLAELADISVGDAWLRRYDGCDGASDLVVRTPRGEAAIDAVRAAGRLTLFDSTPEEILESQRETHVQKRRLYAGRRWLRGLRGRPLAEFPGVPADPSPAAKWAGAKDLATEVLGVIDELRFPAPSRAGEFVRAAAGPAESDTVASDLGGRGT